MLKGNKTMTTGKLLLAPIPQGAGAPCTMTVSKPYQQPKELGITAAQLLSDDKELEQSFRKWLAGRPATKRKAAEYLHLLRKNH